MVRLWQEGRKEGRKGEGIKERRRKWLWRRGFVDLLMGTVAGSIIRSYDGGF